MPLLGVAVEPDERDARDESDELLGAVARLGEPEQGREDDPDGERDHGQLRRPVRPLRLPPCQDVGHRMTRPTVRRIRIGIIAPPNTEMIASTVALRAAGTPRSERWRSCSHAPVLARVSTTARRPPARRRARRRAPWRRPARGRARDTMRPAASQRARVGENGSWSAAAFSTLPTSSQIRLRIRTSVSALDRNGPVSGTSTSIPETSSTWRFAAARKRSSRSSKWT